MAVIISRRSSCRPNFATAPAILMSLSTIIVALNAQLLRRIDLDPAHLARIDHTRDPARSTEPVTTNH